MKIAFYAPFKPIDHPHPSGDAVIGKGLYDFLQRAGHRMDTAGRLRLRWFYLKIWRYPYLAVKTAEMLRRERRFDPDLWLTYHTYYKAPDVIGPAICKRMRIPYTIFQGIYSTKRKRRLATLPGYLLNTAALKFATHIFSNKRADFLNLKRVVSEKNLTYVAPGIETEDFRFDAEARQLLRRRWGVGEKSPVIFTAAMFRPGVKTKGIDFVIRTCERLENRLDDFLLVIAGDGEKQKELVRTAEKHLPGRVRFVGRIDRDTLHRYYSASDIFAFPGINESLGMVFLEAQSCGIPVVAFDNAGVPEAVRDGETGFLSPLGEMDRFAANIYALCANTALRRKMGAAAKSYVRKYHELETNYRVVDRMLRRIAAGSPASRI